MKVGPLSSKVILIRLVLLHTNLNFYDRHYNRPFAFSIFLCPHSLRQRLLSSYQRSAGPIRAYQVPLEIHIESLSTCLYPRGLRSAYQTHEPDNFSSQRFCLQRSGTQKKRATNSVFSAAPKIMRINSLWFWRRNH